MRRRLLPFCLLAVVFVVTMVTGRGFIFHGSALFFGRLCLFLLVKRQHRLDDILLFHLGNAFNAPVFCQCLQL